MDSRVQQYLDEVAHLRAHGAISLVSVILFGSAASGAFSQSSDVDLIIVIPAETSAEERCVLRDAVISLESRHGLRLLETGPRNPLELFAEHAGGHAHACFICTRDDLISGDVARIFGLRGAEQMFLERMFLGSVIVSAKTVWGEDLLSLIPLPSLRRLDVFKSLFRSTAFILFCAAIIGVAGLTFTNGTNSIMQLSTEPAMRGRVMALRVGIALGGISIGAPIVGWVANHFGPRWALGIGAAPGFTAALVAVYVLACRKESLAAAQ